MGERVRIADANLLRLDLSGAAALNVVRAVVGGIYWYCSAACLMCERSNYCSWKTGTRFTTALSSSVGGDAMT